MIKVLSLVLALCGLSASVANAVVVTFTVLDERGQPMPARIHLKDVAGKPQRAPNLPFWRDHFVCSGRAEVELSPGSYTYETERGPEWTSASGSFTTDQTNVTARLKRIANLAQEGWWSGELHVHRPVEKLPLLMDAEDLHIAHTITWWNESNLWKDQIPPQNPLTSLAQNRFFHVLAGEDERGGGALLYFNLAKPLDMTGAKREFPSAMKFLREARKQPGVHVDIEKPFWWDTPLWLASGMVDTVGIANNHLHRSGVLGDEAWGRPRDLSKFPGPQGNGRYTQDLYYHILNCGFRIPPSAGSASGVLPNPVGYNRVYVECGQELTWEKWHEGLRAGRSFVSNGPLLRCRVNGEYPGHMFRVAGPLQLQFDSKLDSREPIASLELVHNGRIAPLDRAKPVTISESGWLLVRAIADTTNTFRFASTAPWYIEIQERPNRAIRDSAQFFLDWSRERIATLEKAPNLTPEQRAEVLAPWRDAEKFWQQKLSLESP